MAGGEGYAQAGAATFDTAVNWLMWGFEQKQIFKTQGEERQFAEQAMQGAQRQQGVENQLAQQGAELQQSVFDFGKSKWGEEFGLTKKQALLSMKLAKNQERRTQETHDISKKTNAMALIKNNLNSVLGNDIAMKKQVATWMGAGYGGR